MWETVVGQERAVSQLQRAAHRPVHAYLIVGSRGSGAEEVARAFAAAIVGADELGASRVGRGVHPDVVEIEPVANMYSVQADVRDRVLPEVHAAPIEGERKVVILLDADRLNPESANALLKTLEEPPASTVLMLVTAAPDELLVTVRSRCQRIDLDPLDPGTIRDALVADGVPPDRADMVSRLAGGQLGRARALTGRYARLRDAFSMAPARLDGTGATTLAVAGDLAATVQDALAEVHAAHEAELEALDAEIERAGYPDRAARALRKRLTDRHRREDRRARTDALLEGLTALESVYRDALVSPTLALNTDRRALAISPHAAADALDVCRDARLSFEFNPSEGLMLERLVFHLPTSDREGDR